MKIKRLFCRHLYTEDKWFTDGVDYKCTKCGKIVYVKAYKIVMWETRMEKLGKLIKHWL